MASVKLNDLLQGNKTKDFCKELQVYGYTLSRQCGSHMIYTAIGKPALSIPATREISQGTKRNLLKLILGEKYYSK